MCTVDQAGAAQLLRIGRRFISPMGPSHPVILPRHSRSAQSRRYLESESGCARCKRRGVFCAHFAAWWTRYLDSVSAASLARIPLSLLFLELIGYSVNTVQLHVNAADVLVRHGIDRDGSR